MKKILLVITMFLTIQNIQAGFLTARKRINFNYQAPTYMPRATGVSDYDDYYLYYSNFLYQISFRVIESVPLIGTYSGRNKRITDEFRGIFAHELIPKLSIFKISKDGTELNLQIKIKHQIPKQFIDNHSNEFIVNMNLKIDSCDGKPLADYRKYDLNSTNIRDVLASLNSLESEDFFECKLKIKHVARLGIISIPASYTNILLFHKANMEDFFINLYSDNSVGLQTKTFKASYIVNYNYNRSKVLNGFKTSFSLLKDVDATIIDETNEALKTFIEVVQDYGDMLYFQQATNPAEYESALEAFWDDNKKRFKQAHKTINDNFQNLTIFNIINIARLMQGMQYYIEIMELKILKKRNIDRILRSNY